MRAVLYAKFSEEQTVPKKALVQTGDLRSVGFSIEFLEKLVWSVLYYLKVIENTPDWNSVGFEESDPPEAAYGA